MRVWPGCVRPRPGDVVEVHTDAADASLWVELKRCGLDVFGQQNPRRQLLMSAWQEGP